jgi:hypothetical protein
MFSEMLGKYFMFQLVIYKEYICICNKLTFTISDVCKNAKNGFGILFTISGTQNHKVYCKFICVYA